MNKTIRNTFVIIGAVLAVIMTIVLSVKLTPNFEDVIAEKRSASSNKNTVDTEKTIKDKKAFVNSEDPIAKDEKAYLERFGN